MDIIKTEKDFLIIGRNFVFLRRILLSVIFLLCFFVDQLLKQWVHKHFVPNQYQELFPYLRLTRIPNPGTLIYSPGNQLPGTGGLYTQLLPFAALTIFLLCYFILRGFRQTLLEHCGVILFFVGGVSNLYSHCQAFFVDDVFQITHLFFLNSVFNMADFFILCGIFILVFEFFRKYNHTMT